jgi:dinuclear metal center YbgI/SA1388 family protein
MLLNELDTLLQKLLDIEGYRSVDESLNGLQVERSKREIDRIALAVDASMESFRRAVLSGADLLFVHHGLFWGKPAALTGTLYQRIKFLIENDLALYAVHLPLDAHPELGNNAGIVRSLNLETVEPFGEYHGVKIGYKGRLSKPLSLEQIETRLCGSRDAGLGRLPFGPNEIRTVGIVSGGDPYAVHQAIAESLDLFITGDSSHTIYHEALEAGINVLFGGHYRTEIWGIVQVSKYLQEEKRLDTVVIDIPTGL